MMSHPAMYVNVSGLAAIGLAVFLGKEHGVPVFMYGVGAVLLSLVVYGAYNENPA